MGVARRRATVAVAVLVCLAVGLVGQAAGETALKGTESVQTTDVLGRATGSYMTGFKTFAAAALWNRLDPLLHHYYRHVPLDAQTYMLTTISLVESLDPYMVEPYYIGSWVLVRNHKPKAGLAMAKLGVANNPNSGILLENLAQIQDLTFKDLDGAVKTGELIFTRKVYWTDDVEAGNAYPILIAIFKKAGRQDLVKRAQAAAAELDARGVNTSITDDHND